MKFNITKIEKLKKFVDEFVLNLNKPALLLLEGDLGSGKTTFTKLLAKSLGIDDEIVSPTYFFSREYGENNQFLHMDLYRIDEESELEEFIGMISDNKYIVVIEWPKSSLEKYFMKTKNIYKLKFIHNNSERVLIYND